MFLRYLAKISAKIAQLALVPWAFKGLFLFLTLHVISQQAEIFVTETSSMLRVASFPNLKMTKIAHFYMVRK
jgi:hypothetical protein